MHILSISLYLFIILLSLDPISTVCMIGVNECMRQTANRSDGLLRRDAPAGEAQRDMGVMERKNRIKMNGWETNKHHREKGKEGMGCRC